MEARTTLPVPTIATVTAAKLGRKVLTRLGAGEWWRSVIGATEVRHWTP